jgi:hypothetical protein
MSSGVPRLGSRSTRIQQARALAQQVKTALLSPMGPPGAGGCAVSASQLAAAGGG